MNEFIQQFNRESETFITCDFITCDNFLYFDEQALEKMNIECGPCPSHPREIVRNFLNGKN